MLAYRIIPVTPFQQHCSLIWCDATNTGALLDPGGEAPQLIMQAQQQGITINQILLTHGHLDHVDAAPLLRDTLNIPIIGPHEADQVWLDQLPEQQQMFGFGEGSAFLPQRWLKHGDTITIGNESLEVWHCPGHTPGHVVFYHAAQQLLWTGDVLFAGSIGRTDFPYGNHAELLASIHTNLWPLADDVQCIPGHGSNTTIGREKRTNPYLKRT